MMRRRILVIGIMVGIVLINIAVHFLPLRLDLTDDGRYSLSAPTRTLLTHLRGEVQVEILLRGELNPGFIRLKNATTETLQEFSIASCVPFHISYPDTMTAGQEPIVIHERTTQGRTTQTMVYPYVVMHYNGRQAIVPLLRNNRGLSGEENLNNSIENLEFAFCECLRSLGSEKVEKVAFLEGHGELSERETYALSKELSRFYQIDRGQLQNVEGVLDDYRAIIIADPLEPFSLEDKYIIDQYIMHGGRVLWLVNGVRFSQNELSTSGNTPIIPLDVHLNDMLFRYGIRLRPALVQDMQCQVMPVDVSTNPDQPNWQPMPWTFAPLLLTSQLSPITRNVMQVSSSMVSCLDFVGENDGLSKEVLLATSSASRLTPAPGEADLSFSTPSAEDYPYSYIPIAASVEGIFTSVFAHQMIPEQVISTRPIKKQSVATRQIMVATGSIARGEWQQGQALPLGYSRYTHTQFGNADFLTNAVLWLTDEDGWMALRQKQVALRLINDQRAQGMLRWAHIMSIILPIFLLGLTALIIQYSRKKRYSI